jgi:hypothetical protein
MVVLFKCNVKYDFKPDTYAWRICCSYNHNSIHSEDNADYRVKERRTGALVRSPILEQL